MKLDNFLPVSRQLQKHWIFKDSSYLHCWLEMLFNARFSLEPKTDIYKGVVYTINRGEFIYSRPTYSERLGIPEGKLRSLIKLLISENMIMEVKSLGNNKPTIYKIINYESYNSQPSEHVENTIVRDDVNQVETKSQPSDDQVTTKSQPLKNKDNTVKKEKNENIYISDVIDYLNLKTNKKFRSDTSKTITCLNARWNEGFKNLDDYKSVIDIKCEKWLEDKKMKDFLRPETLFGSKFEGYINEIEVKPVKKQRTQEEVMIAYMKGMER